MPGWLGKLVADLPTESFGSVFHAVRVSQHTGLRIARRGQMLALLVPVERELDTQPDLRLANLNVISRARCRVADGERTETGTFGIVECTSPDPAVQATFIEVLEWMLPSDGRVSVAQLAQIVSGLVRLFAATQPAPRTSVVGLWGELWLIARSANSSLLARAWHSEPMDRWDFSLPGLRVEVKTTTGSRRHHFSLDQLQPPPSTRLLVASVITAEVATGTSIASLLTRVSDSIQDMELRSRVVETAMGSLGPGWLAGRHVAFDANLAAATLRILNAEDVPRIEDPPVEVSHVTFQSDVEDVDPTHDPGAGGAWLDHLINAM